MNPWGSDYVIVQPGFRQLILPDAKVEKLYTGCLWAEGPVYFADSDSVAWSDIPNSRMLRWAPHQGVSVFREDSNFSNGNTLDAQGRLLTCEHGGRRVVRMEQDGTLTVIASRFEGKRLNSPNDLVVAQDQSIWFTDPTYGIRSNYEGHEADSEIGACLVYRCNPDTHELTVVADDFVQPNGLAFSPDHTTLYVSDTGGSHLEGGPHHIRRFEVADAGYLRNGSLFAEISPGFADGMKTDSAGNVWTSAGDGVHCHSSQGHLLGKILIPEVVANLTFGGSHRTRLYITATSSLYAVDVAVTGNP